VEKKTKIITEITIFLHQTNPIYTSMGKLMCKADSHKPYQGQTSTTKISKLKNSSSLTCQQFKSKDVKQKDNGKKMDTNGRSLDRK